MFKWDRLLTRNDNQPIPQECFHEAVHKWHSSWRIYLTAFSSQKLPWLFKYCGQCIPFCPTFFSFLFKISRRSDSVGLFICLHFFYCFSISTLCRSFQFLSCRVLPSSGLFSLCQLPELVYLSIETLYHQGHVWFLNWSYSKLFYWYKAYFTYVFFYE